MDLASSRFLPFVYVSRPGVPNKNAFENPGFKSILEFLNGPYFGPGNVAFGKESLKFGDILINEISVYAMFLELHSSLLHSPSMGEGILKVLF